MEEFLGKLLDRSDFVPQREAGGWTPGHVVLQNASDAAIWLSFLAAAMILVFFASHRRVPLHRLLVLSAAVLFACGCVHFLAAVVFYVPVYRLATLAKLLTAVLSCAAVAAMVGALPGGLAQLQALQDRTVVPPPVRAGVETNARLRQYMVAVLASTLAILVRAALDPLLHSDHVFVMSLLAVVAVAWQGGLGPALVTLTLSLTATVYFFVEPRNTLAVQKVSDQIAVGLFFVCGFIAALLGEAQRASGRQARENLRDAVRRRAALEAEVTRRREIEGALRQREADLLEANAQLGAAQARSAQTLAVFEAFMQNAPVGMAFCDSELRYVHVNRCLAGANGVPAEEHLGRAVREVVPAGAGALLGDFETVLRTGQAALNRVAGDDSGAVWQYNLFPVRHGGGEPVGLGVIAEDVTARVRYEHRLRQSEERYRGLTQAVPQMVWTADATGRVTFYNRRWVDYTGVALGDESIGSWLAAVHPDDLPGAAAAWGEAVAGRANRFAYELRLRRASDGAFRWMLAKCIPLRDAEGRVAEWVGTMTDVDDQKRQAEHLEQMVRERTLALSIANEALRDEVEERRRAEARERANGLELQRSNRELEQFAYIASHDLQEPLRKIQAFGDRLASRFRDTLAEQGRDYIDRMLSSATRMRRLIDDLLTYSRVSTRPQAPERIHLEEVAAGVLSDLEVRIAGAGATVEIGPLPEVEADEVQMRQLLQNLIGNALKFARPGVPPHVRVWAEPAEPPAGTDGPDELLGPRLWFRLCCEDNGIGFEEKYAERIFGVFQRLHGRDQYEGTGVGLAICRKIAERHGGSITARSRPGQGSTFILTLPTVQRSGPGG